ncbi:MAG: YgaP family membrane protein [Bacteroidota bacterium]
MKSNMGKVDRMIRLVLGGLGLLAVILGDLRSPWQIIVLLLSVVFIATSSISFCPLYTLLGLKTNKKN